MKVSVIIATKNEEKNIKRLLESLKNQTLKDHEIIVVDNYSKDKTRQIASHFTKKVFSKGPERSTQKNFGLRKAKGEYILFVDADMKLEKNLLNNCYLTMKKNPRLAGVVINEVSTGSNFLA